MVGDIMKLILVTGLEDSGKDTILDMVLQGSKQTLPDFDHIKFDELIFKKTKSVSSRFGHSALAESMDFSKNIDQIIKTRQDIYSKLEKNIKANIEAKKSVILNGYFTMKTRRGFVPIISEQFFKTFKPDMIVLMEADASIKNGHIVKKGPDHIESVKLQQEINRNYASLYASTTDAVLVIIKVSHGDVKSAIRELRSCLTFAMKQ
jgi:adenylate kinase